MRRRVPPRGRRDAAAAMKAALEQLTRSRGLKGTIYPECIRLYADIRDEAERWVIQGVRGAIESGCSWAEVGAALGVTRQAAHERYSPLILALAQESADAPDTPSASTLAGDYFRAPPPSE